MPRVFRTDKEHEAVLIRGFVKHSGYTILRAKWQERPDSLLTLRNADGRKRVGIEITHHLIDTIAGKPSPITTVGHFWSLVESSLIRRISHRRHLSGLVGRIRFRSGVIDPPTRGTAARTAMRTSAKQLAGAIVDFVEGHATKGFERHLFGRRTAQNCKNIRAHFAAYPLLARFVESLMFNRWTEGHVRPVRGAWACCNTTTGYVTVSLEYIKSSIAQKNRKAANYENWGNADERWLLIAAGGGHINTQAPRHDPGVRWDDPQLLKLCSDSPFDRIVFWEQVGRWQRWLK